MAPLGNGRTRRCLSCTMRDGIEGRASLVAPIVGDEKAARLVVLQKGDDRSVTLYAIGMVAINIFTYTLF